MSFTDRILGDFVEDHDAHAVQGGIEFLAVGRLSHPVQRIDLCAEELSRRIE
jgi:hypothetical protein